MTSVKLTIVDILKQARQYERQSSIDELILSVKCWTMTGQRNLGANTVKAALMIAAMDNLFLKRQFYSSYIYM